MGFDRSNSIRKCRYALRGQRALSHKLLVRGKQIKALAAMIVNGILDVKLTESNGTGEMFLDILRHSIIPYVMPFNSINPSSVIVMDNAAIHHIDSVSNLLQGLGVLLKICQPTVQI